MPHRSRLHFFSLLVGFLLGAPALAQAASPADAAHGRLMFLECQGCHAVALGGQALAGPSLQGVYGRRAASLPGYTYSAALKASGLIWTSTSLNAWLTDPSQLVPGTTMAFPGIASPVLRADIIAYLQTLQ